MKTLLAQIAQFAADDKAGAAVEYAILATAIGLATTFAATGADAELFFATV